MKKVTYIILISNIFFLSCVSVKDFNGIKTDSVYEILNIEINHLLDYKKDTIYLRNKTNNEHFKKLLENKRILSVTNDLELIKILNNDNEISYLVGQLNNPFFIDFNRIESDRVKEYINPLERKDSSGNIVLDYYYVKIFSSRKYFFSKPVFTTNNRFCLMTYSIDEAGIQLATFKKEENKWRIYKYLKNPN